jgi:hypothetical protein
MLRAVAVLDDVEPFVALVEALLDEGKENSIFLVLTFEEGIDVAATVKGFPRQVKLFFLVNRR